jgi:hypothetical protein
MLQFGGQTPPWAGKIQLFFNLLSSEDHAMRTKDAAWFYAQEIATTVEGLFPF